MYLLRRTASRAIASTPSTALFVKPRSITTITPAAFRSQQRWIVPSFQRRFASNEPGNTQNKTETEVMASEGAAPEASETFAQTAEEAPVEENLTPAQEAVQAEPTNASETVGIDALEAATKAADGTTAPASPRKRVGDPAPPNNTVYVGNLYYEVSPDQLKRVFSRFGEVEAVKIVYDNRGLSRGFGYIDFKDINDAQSAVENLDMQVFEGRNLVVQFHRQKTGAKTRNAQGHFAPNAPSKTLFIGNMSFEMSDKDLNDLFRDIRNVMDVRVAIDRRTGQPRGFAHADFIDIASATRAKETLQEKVIYGRQLRIDFSSSGTQQQREKRRPDTV